MGMMGGIGIKPMANAAQKAVKANDVKSIKMKLKIKKGPPPKPDAK